MKLKLFCIAAFLLLLSPSMASAADGRGFPRPSRRSLRAEARAYQTQTTGPTIRSIVLDRTFHSDGYGFSIRYPQNWQLLGDPEKTPPLTMVVMFLSPETRDDAIRENVNLVAEELPTPLTLEEYTKLGIANEEAFFEDYDLLSSEKTRLAGAWPGHRVTFTASHNGRPMTFTQIWTVRGTQAFVWTFADKSNTFSKNVEVFERMLESITMD